MNRISFLRIFLLVLGVALASCRRSADPLEWKITCSESDDLQRWANENFPLLPEDIASDLAMCIGNIRARISGRDQTERSNLLARRLDGRTVRDVLIEGNKIGIEAAEAQVMQESNTTIELVKMIDGTPEAEQARLQARIDFYRHQIDEQKKLIADREQHLVKLSARSP